MKRILLALAVLTLILPAAPRAWAQGEVSIDFFYNNLNDGNWVEVDDYGYCWQPNVVSSNADWRPYTDGHWAYTDVGWTWVSNEDFGWATYHYGRWVRLEEQGWMWVPGYEWGPAWVSWRTGGDSVGWAPLPPTRERVYEGRAITGHVDVEFDIGPAYYNFVDVRYIGEPVLRDRIYPTSRNVTVISQTVNVTNITYTNSTVYNYGPDYNELSRYSTRPIQRLTLQRETNVNFTTGVRGNEVTKVQGDRLVIAAPVKIQRSAQNVAPKNVKAKITQAKIEHGWSGVTDPKAKTQLVEKMKAEDSKKVAPPSFAPNQKAAVGASPATGVSPAAGTSPVAKTTPIASAAPTVSATPAKAAAPSATPAMTPEKGKQKGKRGEVPGATPSATASVADEHAQPTPAERGRGRHQKPADQVAPTPGRPTEQPAMTPKSETPNALEHNNASRVAPEELPQGKQKSGRGRNQAIPAPSEPRTLPNDASQERHQGRNELAPTGQSDKAATRQGRRNAPEDRAQGQPAGGGEGKKESGQQKKKGGEASPTPGAP